MRAIVQHRYGAPDVLELQEVDEPVVQDDRVLVRVHAASVNPVDWHFTRGTPYLIRLEAGLRRPKVTRLGVDVAGRVEAVGRNVTLLQPGDEVFGQSRGSFAEYLSASEPGLARKPTNLTFEEAAAVPVAASTALQGLRDRGRIQPGQKVLVNGASGGVGTFAVQIAKSFGAEVTGVCSTRNVDLVRSLGADRVVDYTREDFTRSGQRYDLILEAVGNRSLADCRRVLGTNGALVLVGAPEGRWLGPLVRPVTALVLSRVGRQRMGSFLASRSRDDLAVLTELLEAGKVTPVIDRHYSLGEVPEALRYLEEGHARGKVVITV